MNGKNYSSDSPVSNKEEDSFSRWAFSERIAQVISERNDPSSIIIGIYGIWGDGKSSVLNFIEKSLENDENVICIKFNPWRFGTEEELLTGFFFDIAIALDTKLIKEGEELLSIVKKSASGVAAFFGLKGVGDTISSFITGPNINDFKSRIEDELKSHKKRVLIFIDDIDRLENTEIHALFRLIKLTANFKYTSYILAFDKDVVAASLQYRYSSISNNAGEAFLEKIIQVPLHLPLIEKHTLMDLCFQVVNEALKPSKINLSSQESQEFSYHFSNTFDEALTTPRKVKLYGNILMFSLPILQGEVNPVDFMLIEGIRIFCPSLYDTIRNNKLKFLEPCDNSISSNNNEEKKLIRDLIHTAIKADKQENTESYTELLRHMFPQLEIVYSNTAYGSNWHSEWYNGKRICSKDYFPRYFTFSIPKGDISDLIVTNLISEFSGEKCTENNFVNPLNSILNKDNASSIIKKLRNKASSIPSPNSYHLAIALSKISCSLPKFNSFFNINESTSQAAILIGDLILNQPNEQKSLAFKCIKKAPSLGFKLDIFKWLKRENKDRPEKKAFSESTINEIGIFLANNILPDILKNAT